MKRYIIDWHSRAPENLDRFYLTCDNVEHKSLILDRDRSYFDFLPEGTVFSPLVAMYGESDPSIVAIEGLRDYHGWYRSKPSGNFFPVSPKFANILKSFNLQLSRFYDAHLLIEDKLIPYYIFQIRFDYFFDLIDYEQSTFCNWSYDDEKLTDEQVKVKNNEELKLIKKERGWQSANFNRAVMKSEFATLDLVHSIFFRTLISERLKNALEAANITGIGIKECPVDFEVSDQKAGVKIFRPEDWKTTPTQEKTLPSPVLYAPKGLRLLTQEAVDNFSRDYPHCTTIFGNLHIGGTVENVAGLLQLQKVVGMLSIRSPKLTHLKGLSNLHSVGELMINDAYKLTSLAGLNNLENIESSGQFFMDSTAQGIAIDGNSELEDISALSKLTSTKYNLYVAYNKKLTNLKGLENISKVGRYVVIDANDALQDISALRGLQQTEKVIICRNPRLASLDGLQNLEPPEEVRITENEQLEDIHDFATLQAVLSEGS